MGLKEVPHRMRPESPADNTLGDVSIAAEGINSGKKF